MDRLTLRVSPDLIRRFDAAAADQGGRSRLLRRLMDGVAQAALPAPEDAPPESPCAGSASANFGPEVADEPISPRQPPEAAHVLTSSNPYHPSRPRLPGGKMLAPLDALHLSMSVRQARYTRDISEIYPRYTRDLAGMIAEMNHGDDRRDIRRD